MSPGIRLFALLVAYIATPVAAQGAGAAAPCKSNDVRCLAEALSKHPVRTAAFWAPWRARPLDERVAAGPPELVDYLRLDVQINRIPLAPSAASDRDEMLGELMVAMKTLPERIRRMLGRRLVGVFLVNEFGGTGFSDAIHWGKAEGAGFIVLDPSVLRQRVANTWAAWKENSPFRGDSEWRIEAVIAHPGDNLRQRAVQYILLHEIAHVLATRDTVHPSWLGSPAPVQPGRYPFYDLSWRWDATLRNHVTRFDDQWADRRKVRYYFGAQLEGSDMVTAYRWLATTNFPTLYAATQPGDDFAESFVTYVHSVLLKRPWEIRVVQSDQVVMRIESCWAQPRCADKRARLEALLDEFETDAPAATR